MPAQEPPYQDQPRSSRSDVERNRKIILDAAADALAHNPAASMADVAQAANLTRATLYRHFGTREKLLEAMRAEALVYARAMIADARLNEGDALDALRRVVDAVVSLGTRFRPLLTEGVDQDPSFLDERAQIFAPLLDVVRRGQRDGRIRTDLPPAWIVTAMIALLTAGVRAAPGGPTTVADMIYTTLAIGIEPPR